MEKGQKELIQMRDNRDKAGKEPPDLDSRIKDANAVVILPTAVCGVEVVYRSQICVHGLAC